MENHFDPAIGQSAYVASWLNFDLKTTLAILA
jgi:hypothetical protein